MRSIHKYGLHEVRKEHIQDQLSVYLHYSKEAEMQYLRLDPRGGNVLK